MKIAVCDPEAFFPLRDFVTGRFFDIGDLQQIERFVRTVVLHDEIVMELSPFPNLELEDECRYRGPGHVITAMGPVLNGYEFFTERTWPQPVPEIELAPALIEIARRHANANEGNIYFDAHLEYLKRVLGIVDQGGSALLCGEFGHDAIESAQRYPEELFHQLDRDWQTYAQQRKTQGLSFSIPPVFGIVLTRSARRDAVPAQILDLRNEWADARKKVWDLIDSLRVASTLREALDIENELAEASKLFWPKPADADTRPIRILWQILASAAAGAGIAALSGGNIKIGAISGAIANGARELPAFTHDFGATIFGHGAFDLARRVRRGVSLIEFDALSRLLTETEKQKLGF